MTVEATGAHTDGGSKPIYPKLSQERVYGVSNPFRTETAEERRLILDNIKGGLRSQP